VYGQCKEIRPANVLEASNGKVEQPAAYSSHPGRLVISPFRHEVIHFQFTVRISENRMNSRKDATAKVPSKQDLEAMSEFRYQLRQFLRFSEEITHAEGVTPLQYQLLLHVRGFPSRQWASVGELAERLQAAPNGTAALVSRCESAGLVLRKPDDEDRRQVQVHLTAKGERCLLKLAVQHKSEIESFGWVFSEADKQ
jgi:DNA-binding MarR family transcriptional regulator